MAAPLPTFLRLFECDEEGCSTISSQEQVSCERLCGQFYYKASDYPPVRLVVFVEFDVVVTGVSRAAPPLLPSSRTRLADDAQRCLFCLRFAWFATPTGSSARQHVRPILFDGERRIKLARDQHVALLLRGISHLGPSYVSLDARYVP